ncbi:MAG TPA: tetratricopeptide repeat protein [Bryobacteraceae bacterium]|nr:tetratricopeptide repeat protein [Bryobacteraceae bacterium]
MSPERWQQIKAIFQTAADLESGPRAAYLDEACAGADDLRREVEALLAASSEAEDFIESPALEEHAGTLAARLPDPIIGQRVGHFRVTGEIGRGGMGVVYRAVRDDEHFEQQVAIKIVQRGMDTDFIVRRFRHERQILAGLEHPNIARLVDGGATDDGLPYYVMEYIEGQPIHEYCAARNLDTRQRVRLFLSVCAAVDYAHQKRVVHRDLKPGNILITSGGLPKLLDFGIAKILQPEMSSMADDPTRTLTSQRMMTPAYASPEQVRGAEVTPSSDVYSLGVLLYELLSGRRPYRLKGTDPYELAREICETQPERPGLESDLDSIILTALHKDPRERYPSAQALSEDLRRYLDREPVLARARRGRKGGVAAAAAVMAVVGFFGWQTYRPREGPSTASAKARPAIAVLGFKNLSARPEAAWLSTALTEMLSTELAAGEQLRPISGEKVAQVKQDLSLGDADSFSPDTLQRIHTSAGADYVVLGSYLSTGAGENGIRLDLRMQDAHAGEIVVAATEMGRESDLAALVARAGSRVRSKLGVAGLSGPDAERARAAAPSNAEAARYYSEGIRRLHVFDTLAAREFLEKAETADPSHALTHSALAMALTSLGDDAGARRQAKLAFDLSKDLSRENRLFVEGRYYETENQWEKATTSYRALYGFFPDNLEYGLRLAAAQASSSRGREALETLDGLRRLPKPESQDPLIDLGEGNAAATTSDYPRVLAAAARAEAKGLAQGSRILVAKAKLLKGKALTELGKTDLAIQALEECRTLYSEAGHKRGVAQALNGLANLKRNMGDLDGAKRLHEQALSLSREIGNLDGIADGLNSLAIILKQQGDYSGAKKKYREALALRRQGGAKGPLAVILNNLANAQLEQGELGEVKDLYTQALAIARESGGKRMIARSLNNLGLAMRHECAFADAKSMYQESIALRKQLGDSTGEALVLHNLAEVLQDQGDLAGAKKAELESLAIQRKQKNKRGIGYALWALGNFALAEGDLQSSERFQKEALSVRNEIGEKNTEAQSKLSMAMTYFEMGRLEQARRLAEEAAAQFRQDKTGYQEASAQAVLALTLASQKKSGEARKAMERAAALGRRIEIREARLTTATLLARANALLGGQREARRSLEDLLVQASTLGLVPAQWNIKLALAELELASGDAARARARLTALSAEAGSKGYGLIARKANTKRM